MRHMISRQDIDRVIEEPFAAWRAGRTVFVMGNGGSASTATHFAWDGPISVHGGGGSDKARLSSQNLRRATQVAKDEWSI